MSEKQNRNNSFFLSAKTNLTVTHWNSEKYLEGKSLLLTKCFRHWLLTKVEITQKIKSFYLRQLPHKNSVYFYTEAADQLPRFMVLSQYWFVSRGGWECRKTCYFTKWCFHFQLISIIPVESSAYLSLQLQDIE